VAAARFLDSFLYRDKGGLGFGTRVYLTKHAGGSRTGV
jgi:hypothetical protein